MFESLARLLGVEAGRPSASDKPAVDPVTAWKMSARLGTQIARGFRELVERTQPSSPETARALLVRFGAAMRALDAAAEHASASLVHLAGSDAEAQSVAEQFTTEVSLTRAAVTQASEALEDILDIALLEEAAKEDDGARIPLSAAKLE